MEQVVEDGRDVGGVLNVGSMEPAVATAESRRVEMLVETGMVRDADVNDVSIIQWVDPPSADSALFLFSLLFSAFIRRNKTVEIKQGETFLRCAPCPAMHVEERREL